MDDQLLDSHPRRHDTEGEWQVPVDEEVVAPPAVRFVVVLERFVSGGRGGIDMHPPHARGEDESDGADQRVMRGPGRVVDAGGGSAHGFTQHQG
jgi:hypothetical protein